MQFTNTVTEARFRPATAQESSEALGDITFRVARFAFNLLPKICGTVEMWRKNDDILSWQVPYVQQAIDWLAWQLGAYDRQFISTFPSLIVTRHSIISETAVAKALLELHRNEDPLANLLSAKMIRSIIQQTFPEDQFTSSDIILTCDRKFTQVYHKLLVKAMSTLKINTSIPHIQLKAHDMLIGWVQKQDTQAIDLLCETRLYATQNFTKLLFGEESFSQELAKAVDFLNIYIVKSLTQKLTREESVFFEQILGTFRQAIELTLEKDNLPLFVEADLSLTQKKAMIFTLLFAGQETTSALLTYMLWQLASNPESQEELFQHMLLEKNHHEAFYEVPAIKEFFNQSMAAFPPAYGIARLFGEDTCLEYQVEGEDQYRKRLFFKGETISVRVQDLAAKYMYKAGSSPFECFAFGSGPHTCPGWKLATVEICEFIGMLIKNYKIHTSQKEVAIKGQITKRFAQPVYVTLMRR